MDNPALAGTPFTEVLSRPNPWTGLQNWACVYIASLAQIAFVQDHSNTARHTELSLQGLYKA